MFDSGGQFQQVGLGQAKQLHSQLSCDSHAGLRVLPKCKGRQLAEGTGLKPAMPCQGQQLGCLLP